jgi:glycosyltransferase involved in cell wall biosynthesis
MLEGREKDGKINLNRVRFVEVPFGNNSLSFREADYNNFNKHRIVYFGGIIKNKGCELFVPLVKSLLASGLLDVELWIVGGGDIDYLKKEISDNNLDYCINVLGRIENQKDVDKILLTGGVAIAPYYPEDKNSFSYYSDPGKVKIYLGCGLPIVITGVPPIASSIMKNNAGLVADYSADDFSDKIMKILSNYSFYKINAIKFGKNFDWNNIFDRVSLLNKKIDK